MDEDVPLQTRVGVPIWLALAGGPSWGINKMPVHHVYLHRVWRADECTTRIRALAISGGVPVCWGRATRKEVATTGRWRHITERWLRGNVECRWAGRRLGEWVVGGRESVALRIDVVAKSAQRLWDRARVRGESTLYGACELVWVHRCDAGASICGQKIE
jgi:hypothetical protein